MRLVHTIFLALLTGFTVDFPLTRNISALEALWVLVNLVGAYYSLTNFIDAEASRRAALAPPVDRAAVVVAEMSSFIQKYITITQTGFGALGCVAWMVPAPEQESVGRSVIVLGLIALATLLAYKSYRVRLYRRAAYRVLEEERAWHTPRA